MSTITYHYTYIILNKNTQMKYIGVRSCSCLPENDDEYMGSSKILGETMVNQFFAYKMDEWDRYHQAVTDWEVTEYLRLY